MAMPVCRLGDRCSGHGPWFPRTNISASGVTVLVNGRPSHVQGDAWIPHYYWTKYGPVYCPAPQILRTGSATVRVAGRSLGKIGSPVCGGSIVISGSGNVIAGG